MSNVAFEPDVVVDADSPHCFQVLPDLLDEIDFDNMTPALTELLERFGNAHLMMVELSEFLREVGVPPAAAPMLVSLINSYGLIVVGDEEFAKMRREMLAAHEEDGDAVE